MGTVTQHGWTLTSSPSVTADPANNRSLISWSMTLYAGTDPSGNYSEGFSGYSPVQSGTYINTNGTSYVTSVSGQITINHGSTYTWPFISPNASVYISHNSSTGALSVPVYGRVEMQNPWSSPNYKFMPPTMSTTTDYVGSTFTAPGAPTAISLSRTSNGTKFTASASGSSGGTTWNGRNVAQLVEWQYAGGSWTAYSSEVTMDNTRVVYLRAYARSGTSYAWQTGGYSGVLATAYAAPSITSVSSMGPSVSVVVAPPSDNGGSTISNHYVDYSTSSTFASGVTTATIAGSAGGTATFSVAPGQTWYFRSYYTNAAGFTSPYSVTSSQFVSAYGQRYDATSGWVTVSNGERYDGTNWVAITSAQKNTDGTLAGWASLN